MNKLRLTREVKVGIMAIVAIFVLYFGLNYLKGVDIFSPIQSYYGSYEDIGGLVPSSPVFIKGYKVGQVEEIKYDFSKQNAFVVKVSVTKDIKIPQGTVMELFDDGLMGGKAIRLIYSPYDPAKQAMHKPGDELACRTGAGLMDEIAGNLMPQIESVATQADSLLRSVRLLIDGEAVQSSLGSIQKTTSELEITSASLRKMMQQDMPGILRDVNVIAGDFKTVSGNLSKIDFGSTVSKMDVTINDLNSITGKINKGEGSIGLLLNDPELYKNLSGTAGSADNLLIDLKQNPKRYVHFSLFGPRKPKQ
jgi:phospholipid/cholesterol/gamma-HCH transport system substrate-binding protein